MNYKSKYGPKQGQYRLKHPEKYIQAIDKFMGSELITEEHVFVKYKSNLELQAFIYCDLNPCVEKWGLETFHIQYAGTDGKLHRYFPDLLLTIQGKVYIIEIKHSSECRYPKKGKNFELRLQKFLTNQLKWEACRKFCEARDSKFVILTEEVLT